MTSRNVDIDRVPLINNNKALQDYYCALESRIGYRLVLGGTRHFGYYAPGTYWPFPIGKALRAMEDNLIETLALKPQSTILDAGCGVGHVAIHLAKRGYKVHGIDVVDRHIARARRNVQAEGLESEVKLEKADYHHLNTIDDESFDGAYTMETFVHATEPDVAAAEFFRILRPGGSLVMYEYDHLDFSTQTEQHRTSWLTINKNAAMPANAMFQQGVLPRILEEAGFEDVTVEDLSQNVLPMLRMFYILAFIPYLIIAFLGLKGFFVNTVAGYEGYLYKDSCRYIRVSAKKPAPEGGREELHSDQQPLRSNNDDNYRKRV